MSRENWRASNLLYPLPAVLVSAKGKAGKKTVMTAAWAGTVCSDPVMVSVSIRKSRYTHELISESKEFVLNLTTESMLKATDYVGVMSGRKIDKFALKGDLHLTEMESEVVSAPSILESPVCLECKVEQILELGSHDMFIAKVVNCNIDQQYLDENGRLDLAKAKLIAYSHGEYFSLGKKLGTFGYSVRKKKAKRKSEPKSEISKKKSSRNKSVTGKRKTAKKGERKRR